MSRGPFLVVLAMLAAWACTPTPYGEVTTGDGTKQDPKGDDDTTGDDDDATSSGGPNFDAGTTTDSGAVVTQACDPAAAFGAPALIQQVSDPIVDELSLTLTGDERTMIINRNSNGSDEIVSATRASLTATWGSPTPVNSGFFNPWVSLDGKTFFSTDETPSMYQQTRDATAGTLGTATKLTLTGFTQTYWDSPSLSPDGNTFCWDDTPNPNAQNPASRVFHVKCSARTGTTLAAPTTFASLESFGDAFGAVFSPDRLTLYFGHHSTDGWHVYETTRTSTTADFGTPAERTELSTGTGATEIPKFISSDACRLYMAVLTPTAQSWDVYIATRPPK